MACESGPNIVNDGLVLALDAGNKSSYSQNEFQYSTDLLSWAVAGGNNSTLSRDSISTPVGNTPLKMAITGDDPYTFTYNSSPYNIAPALNGQKWIVSVYVKASVATTGQILIFGANSSGSTIENNAYLSLTSTTVNISTEWTRVQHVHTMNNANVAYIHVRLDGTQTSGSGTTIWWDGLQVEKVPSSVSSPTPFTSRYHGGNTWKDLSGSANDFTATTMTAVSDATAGIVYDHNNSTVANVDLSSNINHEVWSVIFWAKSTGTTPSDYRSILRLEDTASIPVYFYQFDTRQTTNSYVLGYQKHYDGTVSNDQWLTRAFTSSSEWATGDWFCFGVSHNSTAFKNYKNGQLHSTDTQSLDVTGYGDINRIKINNNSDNTVHMGPVLLYDKVLTDAEFEQNFNAYRGRFGI